MQFGLTRRGLTGSPLYEKVWLTRAGMRSHHVSRDVLVIAKKKEETGEGQVDYEESKKEEVGDEDEDGDLYDTAENAVRDGVGDEEAALNGGHADDDTHAADELLGDDGSAWDPEQATNTEDAYENNPFEGSSPSRPAAE